MGPRIFLVQQPLPRGRHLPERPHPLLLLWAAAGALLGGAQSCEYLHSQDVLERDLPCLSLRPARIGAVGDVHSSAWEQLAARVFDLEFWVCSA
jgi:hypothetical protein